MRSQRTTMIEWSPRSARRVSRFQSFCRPGASTTPTQHQTIIPEKFHSTATSGLQVEVKEGENPPFDFDLAK